MFILPTNQKNKPDINLDELNQKLDTLDVEDLKVLNNIQKNKLNSQKIKNILKNHPKLSGYIFWMITYHNHLKLARYHQVWKNNYSQESIDNILKLEKIRNIILTLEHQEINNTNELFINVNKKFNREKKIDFSSNFKNNFQKFKKEFPDLDWSGLVLGTNLTSYLGLKEQDNKFPKTFMVYSKSREIIKNVDVFISQIKKNTIFDWFWINSKNKDIKLIFYSTQVSLKNIYDYFGEQVMYDIDEDNILISFENYQKQTYFIDQIQIDTTKDTNLKPKKGILLLKKRKPYTKISYLIDFMDQISKNIYPNLVGTHFRCYICNKSYNPYFTLKSYPRHCLGCAIIEKEKQSNVVDLSSYRVYVSGCRIKIGYATTLRLLRLGAKVIGSTRFPNLAWNNYRNEPDFEKWKDNLEILEANFKNLENINTLIDYLVDQKLNVIINNAAQTIKPSDYYMNTLSKVEKQLKVEYPNPKMIKDSDPDSKSKDQMVLALAGQEQIHINLNKYHDIDDPEAFDTSKSSWFKNIEDISTEELLEVHLINQIVPAMIVGKVKPTMPKPGFIINVSSCEGQFNTKSKEEIHVHTNMTKAGLNMMIRTLIESKDADKDYYYYVVDPGFVSGVRVSGFKETTPIQSEDGASRILDPLISFQKGKIIKSGNYKHYLETEW